jgi:hypothetical protein
MLESCKCFNDVLHRPNGSWFLKEKKQESRETVFLRHHSLVRPGNNRCKFIRCKYFISIVLVSQFYIRMRVYLFKFTCLAFPSSPIFTPSRNLLHCLELTLELVPGSAVDKSIRCF